MNKSLKLAIFAIFVIGTLVRFADAVRPVNRSSWREADVAAIARNFSEEGMNVFYPRIDWRGTTPGYAEMEFPAYPFLIAAAYKIFGRNDLIARLIAVGFSLTTLGFFFALAREYLNGTALVAAFAFFAFNPLIVEASTAVQPEGLMIMFYVGAVLFFSRWIRTGSDREFLFASLLTSLALLSKLTAAHIGVLFAVLLFRKYGIRAVASARVWIFGVLSLVPAGLWYAHAKSLWTTYGNSLGVSNEHHWIGADFFTNPYFAKGIVTLEAVWVWSVVGLIVGSAAIARSFRERSVADPIVWTAACLAFYLITARTSADDWAAYYHIFSVPPAALLFGAGIAAIGGWAKDFADGFSSRTRFKNVIRIATLLLMTAAAVGVFLVDARKIAARMLENRTPDPSYACSIQIRPKLADPGLILASGDRCFDPDGYEVAYNASFMFYWLDRKGFNICVEEQSLDRVRAIASAGARYFVAQRYYMKQRPGFEDALRREYSIVDECGEFVVFDLGR